MCIGIPPALWAKLREDQRVSAFREIEAAKRRITDRFFSGEIDFDGILDESAMASQAITERSPPKPIDALRAIAANPGDGDPDDDDVIGGPDTDETEDEDLEDA